MPSERIQSRIIELCSEDAYGSWELWWSLGAKKAEERDFLCDRFIEAVQGLVSDGENPEENDGRSSIKAS
jgi:hypothetical protein